MSATIGQDAGQAEARLVRLIGDLERRGWGWRAVHLHLSRLRPHNRRPFHLRIAAAEFDGLLARHAGELFQLGSGDLIYVGKDVSAAEIDAVVLRLRHLFSDDPSLREGEPGDGRFCTWYDIETDYEGLRAAAERALSQAGPGRAMAGGREEPAPPLDPARLAQLERALAGRGMSEFLRCQPICAMPAQEPPEPIFAEIYVSIAELGRELAPGIDLAHDRWLFQRLTESLDRRLLATLASDEAALPEGDAELLEGPVSLNLNLATVLSREFAAFDRTARPGHDARILIELHLLDLFADLGAYLFARDYLRERGYLICIDGLHHLHLPLISRRKLGADFIKVQWTPDLLDEVEATRLEKLRAVLERNRPERVILCRCDSADAIAFGQSVGVSYYQGRFVDSRRRGSRPKAVREARAALRAGAARG